MPSRTEVLLTQLQENSRNNPEAWANILRGWLSGRGSQLKWPAPENNSTKITGAQKAAILLVALGDKISGEVMKQLERR